MDLKVSKTTILRTVVLLLAIINQFLAILGKSPLPVDNNELSEWLSWGFTTTAAIWAWWKNNSFTKNAIKADESLKRLKSNKN